MALFFRFKAATTITNLMPLYAFSDFLCAYEHFIAVILLFLLLLLTSTSDYVPILRKEMHSARLFYASMKREKKQC